MSQSLLTYYKKNMFPKSFHRFLALLLIIALSGCVLIAEQYSYIPSQAKETPASMQFRVGTNEHPVIHIRKVDGKYLFDHGGTVSKAIKDNKILLSPGEHKLTLWVTMGGAFGEFEAIVNVKAGEYYILNAGYTQLTIEDRKGNAIYEVSYKRKTIYY